MFTGIAGALGALVTQFVAPDSFPIFLSLYFIVGIVVGGIASITGAVFGAIFIEFVPNIAEAVSKAAPSAVYGVILIIFMFLMPSGVWGFLRPRVRRLLTVTSQASIAADDPPKPRLADSGPASHLAEPREPARTVRDPAD